jgi:hypothetical protein
MSSILTDVKKVLGLDADYTAFDVDVTMHINSVFSTLNQLGVGPEDGFMIEDATPAWSDFLGADNRLNAVKTYVYLRVRLLFDPPTSSYGLAAMQEQAKELEWRLNVQIEHTRWVDPTPVDPDEIPVVLDGGGA